MTSEERFNELTLMGGTLLGKGDPQQLPIETLERASELLEEAYKLMPDHPIAMNNVATIRDELSLAKGGPFVGEELYRDSLRKRVTPEALHSLGRIVDLQHCRMAEAIDLYKQAVIQFGYRDAAYNMSTAMLLDAGRTDEPSAWRDAWYWYESRPTNIYRHHPMAWHGEPLSGKRLVIMLDWGIGDRIWAMRWVRQAFEEGAHTIVITDKNTLPLVMAQPYVNEVYEAGNHPAFEYEYCISALSMAGYMDPCARERSIGPYLKDKAGPFPPSPKRRIGLAWHGSTVRGYPSWRNIPINLMLAHLPALGSVDFEVVSLQKGDGEIFGVDGIDCVSIQECKNMLDTASLIRSCDLVITVGSMVSMLAPALGVETWVVNTKNSSWLFGPSGHDTYWFEHITAIFRQKEHFQWVPVLEEVNALLNDWRLR